MARTPRRGPSVYQARIASYLARHPGATRQEARGKPVHEHIVRAERARAAGKLTEADKRWLKQQQKRIGYERTSEAGRQRWAAAVKAFEALSPEERFNVKAQQQDREKNTFYADLYAPMYGADLTPLYLSSRSGLR